MFNILRILFFFLSIFNLHAQGILLPPNFENSTVIDGLVDPSAIGFSPDGNLFICERISGNLRIAKYDSLSQAWNLLPNPFYTFDVPTAAHRSSGLRGITFDPNFENNGYVYAFYMKNNPRHNRVVRIQANPSNPDVALPGETLLIEVPFNNSSSSGSHNGGDLVFGADGKLYFTTGDGWNGGDDVQSLSTFAGKVFRINPDGSIPTDNPFYNIANGDYRAIYCIGLRNPYTIARAPSTGNIYVNDAVGSQKATVYQINSDGSSSAANFGHDGFDGIGTQSQQWTNTAVGGSKLITGGAWYPNDGYWPAMYHGSYFAAMWGSNSGDAGHIVRVVSENDASSTIFASNVFSAPRHKPVMTEIGPDGNLYYLMTDYQTGNGTVNRIRYTDESVASAPVFTPLPGQFDDPIKIAITSSTSSSTIYYTLDGSVPNENSIPYSDSIDISEQTNVNAIAIANDFLPSPVSSGEYFIGEIPNIAPIANAGPNLIVEVGKTVTLNGSNSYDPDGSPLEIIESWKQVDGIQVDLFDDDETVANFTPQETGSYVFQILVEDSEGAKDSAVVKITAVAEISDVLDGLIARWSCEEGNYNLLDDTSPNANNGVLDGVNWSSDVADGSDYAMRFNGNDDLIDIGNIDITNSELSICFWTKINSFTTHDARFISKAIGQNDADHFWMISTLNGNQLRFRLNTSQGATSTLISDPGVLNLNEWIHITAVYDGQKMRLFKNGNEVASMYKNGNIASDPSIRAAIGNQPVSATGGVRPLDGWMDEIRIYGRALSKQEIDIIRLSEVEKCNSMVVNSMDDGNGSFRRAIACAASSDTIAFMSTGLDTIKINSQPIVFNSPVHLKGNLESEAIILGNLGEAFIEVSPTGSVFMESLKLISPNAPVILNKGDLTVKNVSTELSGSQLIQPVISTSHSTKSGFMKSQSN